MGESLERFRSRWAVIAGASSPLGRALALHLGQHYGMHLVLHYRRRRTAVLDIRRTLHRTNRSTQVVLTRADLHRAVAVDRWLDRVRQYAQDIGVVLFNAADFRPTPWRELAWRDFLTMVTLHGWAPFRAVQQLHGQMRSPARVVFIIDAGVQQGYPRFAAYTATKALMAHWIRMLARALSPGITVHGIAPYWIAHGEEPFPPDSERLRYGEPTTVASLVQALDLIMAAGGALTGQILWMDSGRWLG